MYSSFFTVYHCLVNTIAFDEIGNKVWLYFLQGQTKVNSYTSDDQWMMPLKLCKRKFLLKLKMWSRLLMFEIYWEKLKIFTFLSVQISIWYHYKAHSHLPYSLFVYFLVSSNCWGAVMHVSRCSFSWKVSVPENLGVNTAIRRSLGRMIKPWMVLNLFL